MRSFIPNSFVLLAALLSLGTACREPVSPPPARSAPPRVSSDAQGAPFDLGTLVRRAHFAYRPDGDGWTASHGTWSARVTRSEFTFTPRHSLLASRQILTGTPVTLGPVALSRGGVPLDSTVGAGTVSREGSLTLVRGLVEEQLQNGEDGIEQRWVFARAPQGEGELLLRVPVRGLRYAGETSHGVHFADASGLGVRYSHAAWTDAAGRRTEIRARAVAGAVEFRVPATLLASSSFPVMLAPTVSPEFGLDTPVTDPGGGAQTSPAVASNGTDYLVVWADDRGGDVDVYGARVGQDGTVLDNLGIPIAQALNAQQSPAVAFDGTNYLVVWSDGRRGSGTDIYGARVSPAGSVLDPSGLALSTSSVFTLLMSAPAIAFDGTNYLIVWDEKTGFSGPTNLMGLRVSPAGTPVGSPFTVSGAAGNQLAAALAFDGTNYLAAWQDHRSGTESDIYAARISPAGAVLDSAGIAVSTQSAAQTNPTIAFNGSTYLIVWEDSRNQASTDLDLYGARVSPAGAVLDTSGRALIVAASAQTQPALTRVGSQYLLAWQDLRDGELDLYAARVDGAGTVLDASGALVVAAQGNQSLAAVASIGPHALITWSSDRTADIIGARVDTSTALTVLDPSGFTVSLSPNSETSPAVAFDGTNYLVVWQDNRGSGFDLYGVRVSGSGTVLDPAGFPISAASGNQRNPAVAFDGTNYLIVWEDTRSSLVGDIFGARVSPSGTVLDADGLQISLRFSAQAHPAVAFDGTNYLVVWEDGSAARDIYGTRVSRAGTVLDPSAIAISTDPNDQASPAIAYDGTNYLVAWTDWRNNSTADIYGSRVGRTGSVLDPAGAQLAGGDEAQTDPALAFDGTNYLLVWSDYQSFPSTNLLARRVRTAGTPLDNSPFAVSSAEGHQQQASIVYTGTEFLVAWQDGRSGTGTDLYGGRVSRTGTALDGDGFVISANAVNETDVVLSSGGSAGVLAVYQVADPSLGSNVQRLKARRLTNSSGNTPPTAVAQSVTGDEDVPLPLELLGLDADGDTLVYTIVTAPAHGTLTGAMPKPRYLSALHYNGSDSFTFTVSDGQATSAPATVSITIRPTNDAPVAAPQTVTTAEDTEKAITLTGSDLDNDPLSFIVITPPARGTLTGTPPNLIYTPAPNYFGPDRITFVASDGQASSSPTAVSITVSSVNDAPVAHANSLTTSEDTPLSMTLSGSDVEGDALSFAVASQPTHGTLTGTPPNLTYTPAPAYNGPDSFTFTVSDGVATSTPATISITVDPTNTAPVATSQSITLEEDTPVNITLSATDADGDTLTFTITPPAHGTLTGTAPNLIYTPAPEYFGPDSFTFTVSDGVATSAPATVSLTVTSVNDTPAAQAQALTVPAGSPTPIYLSGSDIDSDDLTFSIASPPEQGSITGTPPDVVYTPPAGFTGTTRFTFSIHDGSTSSSAEVQLTVVKRSLTVSAAVDTVRPAAGQQVRFYANAVDERGDAISLQWEFGDGQTSQDELPVHSFASAGTYDVRLKASTATEEAITMLRMRVRSAAPITLTDSTTSAPTVIGVEGSSLAFELREPQSGLTYTWDFGDSSPATTGTTASHTWADDGSFTLKVSAAEAGGPRVVATRTVIIHNTPPVPLPQEKLSTKVGQPISAQLSGSDAAGTSDPLRWELVSGEGTLGSDGTFTWTPSQEGLATVITKVLDGDGGESRLAFQISTSKADPEPEQPDPEKGCGCGTSSGGAPGAFGLGLLMLALFARSRRAHS
ncbi:MAG TPA: Ig-like domain-containing protein [Hyalangium sp.]|nr:Ig-like domain-containing protein [Hyalangium sp.]